MSSSPLGIYVTPKYNFLDENEGMHHMNQFLQTFVCLRIKKEEKSVNSQVSHPYSFGLNPTHHHVPLHLDSTSNLQQFHGLGK